MGLDESQRWKFVSQLQLEAGGGGGTGGSPEVWYKPSLLNKVLPYYAVFSQNHVFQEVLNPIY